MYFLRSYRITFLLIVGLAIVGIAAVISLPREATPEVTIPVGVVVTPYLGASARDVEELVTKPIEDELKSLEGVKEITSSSSLGISTISVEFNADQDVKESLRKLGEAVDRVRELPQEAETPQVIEISFTNEPIVSISLGGIPDERLLTVYAKQLQRDLEGIAGVSQIDIVGAREEEVRVTIDPKQLAKEGLSIGQLLGIIQAANLNAPFGQLKTEQFAYDLRIVGRFNNANDIANLPVPLPNGSTVPLSKIATVTRQLQETESVSRVSIANQPSAPALTLQVRKKTGGNIIAIVDEVKQEVARAQQTYLPADIKVESFADQAEEIRRSLSEVTRSGLETFVIVLLILWLFLGWQEAFITALSVPLTFFISFLVFRFTNTTLNGISLFSLILSLGLLVDDAIVVVEGIHSRVENDLNEGAAWVINKFKKAIIGSTLTTVAAFLPMLLVSGIIGQFLRTIPIVIAATLLSSLFVALALIPPVAVRVLTWARHRGQKKPRWFDGKFNEFAGRYEHFIGWVLLRRRFQNWFIGMLAILLIIGFSLPFTGLLKTGLFPEVDVDFMQISIELPPGSRLSQTELIVQRVEEVVRQIPEVKSYVANVGSGAGGDFGGSSSGTSLGSLFINLQTDRTRSSIEITHELRQHVAQITEAKVTIAEASAGPPGGAAVELRVIGPDLPELDRLSQEVIDHLRSLPGVIDVDRDLRYSAGEFNFTFDRTALAAAGLTSAEVAQTLRATVFGTEATTFLNEDNEKVTVRVQADTTTGVTMNALLDMPLRTPTGATVRLDQVTHTELANSVDAIRHRDGERTIQITGNTAPGTAANDVTQQLQQHLTEQPLPQGYSVVFGGEQQQTEDTFAELYRSMVIAFILIIIILVFEFNSYRQPLIIFLSIPLGLIGVLFGLFILGGQLNFAAFIGLVSLTGIVVKNAILLVDRMNSLREEEGLALIPAVRAAVRSRLRPIILTTATATIGLVPLLFVDAFFRDMALTLMTGLIFSTIITLVLIPILYTRQQIKIEARANVATAVAS